jgi:hypothetical protein
LSAPAPAVARTSENVGYRIPSLGYRIVVAALRLIPTFFVLIILPVAALSYASSRGIALPISTYAVTVWGIVLISLGAARYILKPTRAFGPVSMATSLAGLLYLLYAISLSPYRLVIPGGSASLVASYSMFLELLLIVPAVGIVVGILVTIEDARSRTERLLFDFPA